MSHFLKKRIIFSSTRNWNPGDEFILFGIKRLLKAAGVDFSEILYNRHPTVRTEFGLIDKFLRGTSFFFAHNPDIQLKHHRRGKKLHRFDNSFFDSDYRIADYVILAGTPEWAGPRNSELYRYALKHKIPGALIGVGIANKIGHGEHIYLSNCVELITTRDSHAQQQLEPYGAITAVCPALFSAPESKPITDVGKIGIVFQGSQVWSNSIPREILNELIPVYRKLLDSGATLLCHHFADVIEGIKTFGEDVPLLYSSDAHELLDCFRQFDIVIGTRLHGAGAAASWGIPGILITHDLRTRGSSSFLEIIVKPERILDTIDSTDWLKKSVDLVEHRKRWFVKMKDLIKKTSLLE